MECIIFPAEGADLNYDEYGIEWFQSPTIYNFSFFTL